MRAQPVAASQNRRIVAGLPFVEALARRMADTAARLRGKPGAVAPADLLEAPCLSGSR